MRDWLDGGKALKSLPWCDSTRPLTANRYEELGNYRRARELTMLLTVEVPAAREARRLADDR